jgi:hypothetical protein
MKKYIYVLSLILIVAVMACNEENFSAREYYKHVVYLLSKENYNVCPEVFPFDNGNEVTGYFSVGCGGSLTNSEGFTVELEPDTVLLNTYNRSNFDIDTTKYAKLLDASRYRIETNQVTFPALNKDQYVKVAVMVTPDGLSPDSTYFIPIAIKSVSKYEVNPEKSNILLKVGMENYYAQQLTPTYYQMYGTLFDDLGAPIGGIAGTKTARPLSKNSIVLYAGNEIQTAKSTYTEIKNLSIVLTVDANNHVTITPYGSIQVTQVEAGAPWNTYEEAAANAVDQTLIKWFYLSYRYRTVKTPATKTAPAVYNNWVNVRESIKRLQ